MAFRIFEKAKKLPKSTQKALKIVREESEQMFEALSQNQSFMQDEEEKEVKNPESMIQKSRGNLLEVPVLKSIQNANNVLKPKFGSATLAEIMPLEPTDEVLKGKLSFIVIKLMEINTSMFRRHAHNQIVLPSKYNDSS